MQNMPIGIFRGDDTDAFGYQTIVGTINTDLDLTGCKAVFRYLGFSMEFDPIPEDKKLTIIIPADETRQFPPGLGYASLRVYDSNGKLKTFSNRIMVFVATKTPMFGSDEFEVDFNVRATLEPLRFFVGPNPDDFDEYRGYVEKVIDRASATKYGLAILLDAIDSDLGANDGAAATPVAVKAAYAAIIERLTDDYYTAAETDEAIDRVAAYYITYTAAGAAFPTYAALAGAQTVYSGGEVRVPTRNDYCVVLADETHGGSEYRYIYAVAEGETTGSWQPQFPVGGVMTVDQTVTKNSANPVSGGGIWSALWGALTALPTGFSSLYDWCVSQLAGKLGNSQTTIDGLTTLSFIAVNDEPRLRMMGAAGEYIDITFSALRFYVPGYWEFVLTLPMATGRLALTSDIPDVNGLASKAANPTAGNLAALDAQGNPTDSLIPAANVAVKSNIPYDLVTKTISNNAVTLDDRAANAVTINSTLSPNTLTVNFPTATTGKVRDFALRLNIAAGVTAPEITWPQGVTLENDGGEVPEIADGGTGGSSTILYFSETATNKFLVKGETLTAIAQA